MSSSASIDKRAAAFRATDGEIIYILYEQSDEDGDEDDSNEPRWDVVSIGPIDQTIKKIFARASIRCGGLLLQNLEDAVTFEGYIEGWMKQLAVPVSMPDMNIRMEGIHCGNIDAINEALTKVGLSDLGNRLLAGDDVSLQLHKDAKAIVAIYGTGPLRAWDILQYPPPDAGRNTLLGYAPAPAKNLTIRLSAMRKLNTLNLLLQREDGSWHLAGWGEDVLQQYVSTLWEAELRAPGGYRYLIKAYSDAIAAAPFIPSGTKAVVDATMVMEEHERRSLRDFTTTFPVTGTPRGFEVEVTLDNARDLAKLEPAAAVTWVLPEEPAPTIECTTEPETTAAVRRMKL